MKLVPQHIDFELSKALIHSDSKTVIRIIEQNNFDINSVFDNGENRTIVFEAICSLNEHDGGPEQIQIVNFLLDKGADPNIKNIDGYNGLHIALEHHDLSAIALLLITKGNADVNATDDMHGNNPLFIAIREYGKTWRENQKEVNQLRFEIIEELLKRGGDLDKINKHGISSRRWLEISDDERLKELILKYEK